MRSAKIIKGKSFDWRRGNLAASQVIDNGRVNWRAAMHADPGVTKCPNCEAFYWWEGEVLECPDCKTRWDPDTKQIVTKRTRKTKY